MITGAHAIVYSKDAEADRAFFRDVLKYKFADAGHGWLIFALPPAEIAIHPSASEKGDVHELYLMCGDVNTFVADMKKKGVSTGPLHEERWGVLTQITLPSGGKLGVYEPRHPSPLEASPPARQNARKKSPARAAKKLAKKTPKRGAKRATKTAKRATR